MPLPADKAWFAAKKFGWGWGVPLRWQGWAVMIGFFATLVAGAPLVKKSPLIFVIYGVIASSALVAVCYWKGVAPRWRWGAEE